MKLFGAGLLLFPTRKVVSQRSLRTAGQTNCKLRKTEEGQLDHLGSSELQGKTIHRAGEKMYPHVLLIFVLDRQDSSWVLGFLLSLTPGQERQQIKVLM